MNRTERLSFVLVGLSRTSSKTLEVASHPPSTRYNRLAFAHRPMLFENLSEPKSLSVFVTNSAVSSCSWHTAYLSGKGWISTNRLTGEPGPERCWLVSKQPIMHSHNASLVMGSLSIARFRSLRILTNGLCSC